MHRSSRVIAQILLLLTFSGIVLAGEPPKPPVKGPNEVWVGVLAAYRNPDQTEVKLKRYLGGLAGMDYILQPDNPEELFEKLVQITKTGKKIRFLIVAGHGGAKNPHISLGRRALVNKDVDRDEIERQLTETLTLNQVQNELYDASPSEQPALRQKVDTILANRKKYRTQLARLNALSEVMADDAEILLLNCSAAATPRGETMCRNLGRVLLGRAGGSVVASRNDIQIATMMNPGNSLHSFFRTGRWVPMGDTWVLGDWLHIAIPETKEPYLFGAFHPDAVILAQPGQDVEISPVVDVWPDSGKPRYFWGDSEAGTEDPKLRVPAHRISGRLDVRFKVRDFRGRTATDTLTIRVRGVEIEGPKKIERGKAASLEAKFRPSEQSNGVSFTWQDLSEDKNLGQTSSCVFKSEELGIHDIRVDAFSADGKALGHNNHKIEVVDEVGRALTPTVTIEGDTQVESGVAIPLTGKVKFPASPAPSYTLKWRDLTRNKDLGMTPTIDFSATNLGDYQIELQVLDSKGKSLASKEHTVTVGKAQVSIDGEVSIRAPKQVLSTEIFTLEAVPGPKLKGVARYRWQAIDGQDHHYLNKIADPPPDAKALVRAELVTLSGYPSNPQDQATSQKVLVQAAAHEPMVFKVQALDATGKVLATSKPVGVKKLGLQCELTIPGNWAVTPDKRNILHLSRNSPYTGSLEIRWPGMGQDPVLGQSSEGLPVPLYHKIQRTGKIDGFEGDLESFLRGFGPRGIVEPEYFARGLSYLVFSGSYSAFETDPVKKKALEADHRRFQQEVTSILSGLRFVSNQKIAVGASPTPPVPVTVRLKADRTKLSVGETIEVEALVEGGPASDKPYTFQWTGNQTGKGSKVLFNALNKGDETLTVDVSGPSGPLGTADLTFQVAGVKVQLKRSGTGPVTVGQSLALTATTEPANAKVTYRWQPHPEMEFRRPGEEDPLEPPETKVGQVMAHFTKPGKVSLWVEALDPKTGKTSGQSESLEVQVNPPQLAIQVDPSNPLVGRNFVARVQAPKDLEDATFRWLLPEQLKLVKESQDSREITLYSKNSQPLELKVLGLIDGEDLGEAKATVSAQSYQVKAMQGTPKGTLEAGTRVNLVATMQPESTEKVTYRWRLNKDSIFTSSDFGREVTVSRSQAGALEATVIATDSRDVELGQARVSVSFVDVPWRGLTDKARQLAAAGQFEQAAALAEELYEANPEAGTKVKKEIAKQLLSEGQKLTKDEKFQKAIEQLKLGRKLDPSEPLFGEEIKNAAEFDARYRTVDRKVEELKQLVQGQRFPSAHQKLYEISQLENSAPRLPRGNYRLPEAQQIFNALTPIYNAYWTDLREQRGELFRAKRWKELVDLCKTALDEWEHTPADEQDLRSGIRDYAKLLREQEQNPAKLAYDKAKQNYEAGNYQQAITSATQVIQANPDHDRGAAWKIRANARYIMSQHEGFISDSEEYLKRRPEDAEALALKGLALTYAQIIEDAPKKKLEILREAEEHYRKAAKLAPNAKMRDEYLSEAAYVQGKVKEQEMETLNSRPLAVRVDPPSHKMQPGSQMQTVVHATGGTPPYRYEWLVGAERTGESSQVKMWKLNSPGNFPLRVLVTDANGRTAEATCQVTVGRVASEPPPVSRGLSVRIDPPNHRMKTGGQMRTNAVATGGNGPYRYEWYVGNERTGVVNQAKMWTFNTPGVTQVRVVATDADGRQAEATCPVTVGGQAIMADQPLRLSLSQTQVSVPQGQNVSVFARPQGGTPPYRYSWYVDRKRSKVTGNGIKLTPTANRTLVAVVTDTKGNSVQAQCHVTMVAGSTASTPPPSSGGDYSGDYTGRFTGQATGTITLQIRENRVAGQVRGDYGGDPIAGSCQGSIDSHGRIKMKVSGSFVGGDMPWSGNLSGSIRGGVASGKWYAENEWGNPIGSWKASRSGHAPVSFTINGAWEERGNQNQGSVWTIRESGGRVQSIANQIRLPDGSRTSWAARNIRWDPNRRILTFDYYFTSPTPPGWETGRCSVQFKSSDQATVNWKSAHQSGTFLLRRRL